VIRAADLCLSFIGARPLAVGTCQWKHLPSGKATLWKRSPNRFDQFGFLCRFASQNDCYGGRPQTRRRATLEGRSGDDPDECRRGGAGNYLALRFRSAMAVASMVLRFDRQPRAVG
jgi:hypothetical protein